MDKFIVITSIFEPSEAVRRFACVDGWQLVVVADKKTPPDWCHENAVFLSVPDQLEMGYPLVKNLSWNHYARKMLGYLYAMQQGAEMIADEDDDNLPLPRWGKVALDGVLDTLTQPGFVNIYRFFTDEFIWPRGFPMDELQAPVPTGMVRKRSRVGIWQFLADEDPDVDAVYRMLFNKPVTFRDREPIVLDEGVYCPFNSQNTLILKDAFAALYLPAFVTFRFTDILRGVVAQPLLWAAGLRLGFGPATAVQLRNPHDYLKDFESEIPAYLQSRKAAYLAADAVRADRPMTENLLAVYESLAEHGIVPRQEVELCQAWVDSLKMALAGRPA